MPPARIQSNDDSFATFAFAVVSVIGIIVFFPIVTGLLRALWRRITGKSATTAGKPGDEKKSYTTEPEVLPGTEDFKTLTAAIHGVVTDPAQVMPTLRACKKHSRITTEVLAPRLVRFMLRPKIFLVVAWIFLFSTVLYSNLTYDPYKALGLTSVATEKEVKKAYRSITMLNHPDRNKTAEAKVIFIHARKAYKAIVDPEAFEKEEVGNSDEFVAGIALPSFMMSGEHDGLTLVLLFSILFGMPYWAYRAFGRGLQERLLECLGSLERNNAFIDVLLAELGIQDDPVLLERRRQRKLMHRALTAAGILPPTAPESAVDGLPPYKEFRAKVLAGERQRVQLAQQFRFEPVAVQALRVHFEGQSTAEREHDEGPIQRRPNAAPLPKREIEARVFLIRRLFDANKATLEDFATHVGTGQLATIQRLLQGQEGASAALDDFIATSDAHAVAYGIAAAAAAGGKEAGAAAAAEVAAAGKTPKADVLQMSARARMYLSELPRRYEEGLTFVRQETTAYLQHRAERKQKEAEAAAAAGN